MSCQPFFDIVIGDTLLLGFEFQDAAGAVENCTGYRLTLQVKASAAAAAVLLEISSTAGTHAADDPAAGVMFLEASSALTAALAAGRAVVLIRLSIPAGTPAHIETLYAAWHDIGHGGCRGVFNSVVRRMENRARVVCRQAGPRGAPGGGGGGDMQSLIYDPSGRAADCFNLSNLAGNLDGGVFT